jgi:hypothetical protein
MILIIISKIIITIFIYNYINFLKLDLSHTHTHIYLYIYIYIYGLYSCCFFFMFILCKNLNKIKDALDLISLNNIDLLNKWICEKPNILDKEIVIVMYYH